ncbi:unnamed protein product [Mytilus coruscus]|uniref:Uncharacterized protein n=1 Tax=Mytilus coruscus TaxID=42192 RepID=A0A6J8DA67_MYTCO|nr:unnamed protein product [Mytilus coruscus]
MDITKTDQTLQLHDLKVAVKRVIENFRRLQDFWEEKSKGEHQLISNDVQKDTLNRFQRFKKSIIIQARQPYATRQIHIVDNEIFPKLKTVWEEKTKAEEHRHILNDTQIDTFNTVYKLHGPIYVHIHRKKNVKTMIIAVNEKCPCRQTETFKSFLSGTGVLGVCFVLVKC